MSLETLLEAAKYLELQEQLNSRPPTLSSPSISSTSSNSSSSSDAYQNHTPNNFIDNSHHNHHHNNNQTRNNNNNHSTNLSNNIQNNSNNKSSRSNHRNRHHYNEYHRRGGRTSGSITKSPPISSMSSSSHSGSLLVNGGGMTGTSNHVAGGGSRNVMGPSSNSTNGNHNDNNSHEFQKRNHRNVYRNATAGGNACLNGNDSRNNEDPCRNGEHQLASPASYSLITANNDTGLSTTLATLSKQDDRSIDSKMHSQQNSCKKVDRKIDINNKRLLNVEHGEQMLQKMQSATINAGYPTESSCRFMKTPSPITPIPYAPPPPNKIKKPTPLTPPPTSSRKIVEITRTRSSSLSSTNFTANVGNGSSSSGGNISTTGLSGNVTSSATDSASLLHSRIAATLAGGNGNALTNSGTEDSSQSSLNLSSSGYLSGSSANSSVGVSSSLSNLNISNSSTSSGLGSLNGYGPNDHQLPGHGAPHTTGRRRTTSSNSSGPGTREVHNKLEKHRRAHLKECFEQLKVQLELLDEEKKKTSNLSILRAAYLHVMCLKKKERKLEQQVEQLAKEKINNQKRILSLKRELTNKHDNFDYPSVLSDSSDIVAVQGDRDSISDTLSSTRGSARYSSSSSLSSATTVPSPLGSSNMVQNGRPPHVASPPVIISSILNASPTPSNHLHNIHHHQFSKSISPVTAIGNSVPLPLTTKSLQQRGSPTPSTPSPSSSSMNGIPPSSPIVSSSGSPSSASSMCASPPIIVPRSPLGALGASSISVPISLKIPLVPNGVKIPLPGAIISSSTSQHIPPSSSPLMSATSLSIISSAPNNSSGVSQLSNSSVTTSSPILNYTTIENNSILSATPLTTASTINSGMPLNLNASVSTPQVQILHAAAAASAVKDLSGKNGFCRKPNDLHHEQSISTSILTATPILQQQHQQPYSSASVAPSSEIIVTNNASTTTTITTKDKMPEDGEQHKFINVLNGLQGSTMGLVLSQIPMFAASPQSLRMLGAGGLATIELSTSQVQSQSRNHSLSSPTSTTTPTTGAQLHKLLVSGTTVSASSGPNSINGGNGTCIGNSNIGSPSVANALATTVSSELARLPGGAEVNLLSRNGKMTIVNNGITLKGTDGPNNRAAMHVVGPLQTGGASMSRLAPLVVSQGKMTNNLAAHLMAPSSQLSRQVNLSVGGQLPIISTPYLTSPMVVAVASNQTQPTLSSVPTSATSVAVASGTANGSVS